MRTHFQKLYGYHAWANADLFDALERLDADRHGQVLDEAARLISHYHVVARIFSAHLTRTPHAYTAANSPTIPPLSDLRDAVAVCDLWYVEYVSRIQPGELQDAIPFKFTDGDKGCMTREEILLHVATHAGYHRGEVGRLLASVSMSPPWDTFAVYLHQTEPSRRDALS